MKVLLLTSAEPTQRHGLSMIEKRFPLGLGYLAAVLQEQQHDVVIHDRFLHGSGSYPDGEDWDLVGIYSNTPCVADTLHLLDYYSGFTTAVGGPHASLFPHTLSAADCIVQGEGEEVILDILAGARGVIKTERIKDLDALPMPAYKLFASDPAYDTSMYFAPGRYFNMNTSRGCPYECSFCEVRKVWGRTYRAHSPHRVVREAAFLREEYGIDGVYFREDNFTVNRHRAESIAGGMMALGLKWACETRVDTVDQGMLERLARGGCVGLYIGFESGSQHMLDVFNKRTTVQQAHDVANWCYDLGIKILGSFITDHPEETAADKAATLAFVQYHGKRALVKTCYNRFREFSAYERFLT